jgi:ADP-L-glycero-D-manno-heptose 6-epimerase
MSDKLILVTGGAGFVGSHLVRALDARGDAVLVVDDLTRGAKFANLADCTIADYLDKAELRRALEKGALRGRIKGVLHQGACTDTKEQDGRYLLDNNFTFSKELLGFALEERVPFVYASSGAVYGGSTSFREVPEHERPINAYGWSKLVLDQHVRRLFPRLETTVVGLRYFNVYGPREAHKGPMASMVFQANRQLREAGVVKLFEGTDGYGDGEQRRDFVFVEDVVRVNLHFLDGPPRRAVVNVGSGASRSFREVAETLIRRRGAGRIEYVPFDEGLRGRYQSYTQADLTGLRAAGYTAPFTPIEEGIARCLDAWERPG